MNQTVTISFSIGKKSIVQRHEQHDNNMDEPGIDHWRRMNRNYQPNDVHMITPGQMKGQLEDYSDLHFPIPQARGDLARIILMEMKKPKNDLWMHEPATQWMKNKEGRSWMKQVLKFHPGQKSSTRTVFEMMDDNEQKIAEFRESDIIDLKKIVATSHPVRALQAVDICYICELKDGPEKQIFEAIACADYLVKCGHPACSYKLHLSCVALRRFIADHNVQYSCLKQNMGTILCPDHYCEICMGQGYQQSAVRGRLVKCTNQHRSFHEKCLPPVPHQRGNEIQLVPRRKKFEGTHYRICFCCGRRDLEYIPARPYQPARNGQKAIPAQKAQEASKLIRCETCCHMFHGECHEINVRGGKETRCEDCIYDCQLRRSDAVLVENNKLFRAAKIIGWKTVDDGGESILQVSICFSISEGSEEPIEEKWVPINEVFRPYPLTSARMYHSIREIYTEQSCKEHDCKRHLTELALISRMLNKLYKFSPGIERDAPTIRNTYQFHEKFLNGRPQHFHLPPEQKCTEDVELRMTKKKGYGVFAKKPLEKGQVIGFYVGECIDETEHLRRQQLGKMSSDAEEMSYTFETSTKRGSGEETPCYVDSASHHNETSFLNSSCLPNCEVQEVSHELADGITIQLYRIVTTDAIKKDQELTINYHWNKATFLCLCNAPKCKAKRNESKLDWTVKHNCDGRKAQFLKEENKRLGKLDDESDDDDKIDDNDENNNEKYREAQKLCNFEFFNLYLELMWTSFLTNICALGINSKFFNISTFSFLASFQKRTSHHQNIPVLTLFSFRKTQKSPFSYFSFHVSLKYLSHLFCFLLSVLLIRLFPMFVMDLICFFSNMSTIVVYKRVSLALFLLY
ncbi:hypothetical protein CAEBREN_19918 [Caenorhabditis brenneri]|uniref:SET domain-containing protein n=1 Tax=Caenorhabditis brenneri TaxID=135651 RepID=G0MHB2_CAEBE|nr:hypothetical protein CAEBREN_19918 [Caenorhabditis brenneri]